MNVRLLKKLRRKHCIVSCKKKFYLRVKYNHWLSYDSLKSVLSGQHAYIKWDIDKLREKKMKRVLSKACRAKRFGQ